MLENGIPDAAYKPVTGDDKDVAKFYERANKDAKKGQGTFDFTGGRSDLPTAPLSAEFSDLRDLPEDTVADVEAKAKAYRSLRKQDAFLRARMGCNLYTAAFLLPKSGEVPTGDAERTVPTSQDVWLAVGQGKGRQHIMESVKAATQARALHWPLEFPDIMDRGGFDLVVGNPPWEVVQLSDKEYFATRKPEIATLAGAKRKKAIEKLIDTDPVALNNFVVEKRHFEAINEFARASERFNLTARGKVNTYGLFAELFANLVGEKGRAGVIVPTGIATDSTTAPFFAFLIDHKRLANFISFENEEMIFSSVHHAFKFALMTISGSAVPSAAFAFFLRQASQILDSERNFSLSAEQIADINPNTKTAPVFRSLWDAELTAKIYRNVPVLIDESKGARGNPWGIDFRQGLFNMATDSGLFRTAEELEVADFIRDGSDWVVEGVAPVQGTLSVEGVSNNHLKPEGVGPRGPRRYLPLYEAKMIHQFDHRWATYDTAGDMANDVAESQKIDPGFESQPRYWVPAEEVMARLDTKGWKRGWLMGWRDITNATNERTVIATVIKRTAVGHVVPLFFFEAEPEMWAALAANMCSFSLDFVARQKLGGTHLTYGYMKQFPVLPPDFYSVTRLAFITPRVLELTYTSHSLAPFAHDLGHDGPPFAWNEDRRAHLRAELDAFYARAYGLTRDELRYILDPADVKGPDYPSETFRVLKEKEIRQHGEYRTRRLVLAAWDRMEASCEFKAMGM